jgi:divalent metal cation (Fe/Co/Zn/Cd) transporter
LLGRDSVSKQLAQALVYNARANPGNNLNLSPLAAMEQIAPALAPTDYQRGVRRVLLVTLVLNIAVVIGKLIAGYLAGSLSVISDAIHSTTDSLNNIVGLVVTKYAAAEPDETHPYGHGKFETLAAFVIAGFLFVTCYQISLSAITRILSKDHAAPEITALTIGVMLATIVINIFVTLYESREGRRLNSEFLIADAIHTRSDVVVSCSVLAGLILVRMGYVWLDPVVSLIVAAVIAWNGILSHAITEAVEKRLIEEFGKVTATIHVEPLPERA